MTRAPFYLSPELAAYVAEHSEPNEDLVADLVAETAKLELAQMQVSSEQARMLGMLVAVLDAAWVLEVGTFTGLSALRMAQALRGTGRLVTCDVSEEWTSIATRYWRLAGVADRISLRLGPGAETLVALAEEGAGPFDLAFIDADKEGYADYVELVHPLLRPDGLAVVDNTLWSGRVVDHTDPGDEADTATRALQAFNRRVVDDDRFETVLLPVFDGLTLLRKRG